MCPMYLFETTISNFLELNKDMYHVYIESHIGSGGERKIIFLRQHERGLPLTLRNNFTQIGYAILRVGEA